MFVKKTCCFYCIELLDDVQIFQKSFSTIRITSNIFIYMSNLAALVQIYMDLTLHCKNINVGELKRLKLSLFDPNLSQCLHLNVTHFKL